jgi:hypothetical protein
LRLSVHFNIKFYVSLPQEFYWSQQYGCPGGLHDWSDGTYSGIRRITLTKNDNSLTSVQLHYGLEGDESVNDKYIRGLRHGNADGSPIEVRVEVRCIIYICMLSFAMAYKTENK